MCVCVCVCVVLVVNGSFKKNYKKLFDLFLSFVCIYT